MNDDLTLTHSDPRVADIDRPLFVCGTGRSGTSFLKKLLSAHPRVFSLRYEGRFIVGKGGVLDLLSNFQNEKQFAQFRRNITGDWFRSVNRRGTEKEYVGGLHVDIDAEDLATLVCAFEKQLRFAGTRDEATQCCAQFVKTLYRGPVAASGKSRWSEKTPTNVLYMAELSELFPSAQFVHIIRDGRDVVASIIDNGFWPLGNPLPKLGLKLGRRNVRNGAHFWKSVLEYARRSSQHLPPNSYLEIRYEDLIHDLVLLKDPDGSLVHPGPTLQSLFSFVGEEATPQMLGALPLSETSIERYKRDFSQSDLETFKEIAGPLLEQYGYAV